MATLAGKLAPLELPDVTGSSVRLGSLWQDGPCVLAFLRHYGWIFCREHVAQLRDHEPEIAAAGGRIAAVGLGGTRFAQRFARETGIRFPLLIDEHRESYRAAGLKTGSLLQVLRPESFRARRRASEAGHRQHGVGRNPFQLGGSFVFGPGNTDHYTHVAQSFGDIAPLAAGLEAVRLAAGARPVG